MNFIQKLRILIHGINICQTDKLQSKTNENITSKADHTGNIADEKSTDERNIMEEKQDILVESDTCNYYENAEFLDSQFKESSHVYENCYENLTSPEYFITTDEVTDLPLKEYLEYFSLDKLVLENLLNICNLKFRNSDGQIITYTFLDFSKNRLIEDSDYPSIYKSNTIIEDKSINNEVKNEKGQNSQFKNYLTKGIKKENKTKNYEEHKCNQENRKFLILDEFYEEIDGPSIMPENKLDDKKNKNKYMENIYEEVNPPPLNIIENERFIKNYKKSKSNQFNDQTPFDGRNSSIKIYERFRADENLLAENIYEEIDFSSLKTREKTHFLNSYENIDTFLASKISIVKNISETQEKLPRINNIIDPSNDKCYKDMNPLPFSGSEDLNTNNEVAKVPSNFHKKFDAKEICNIIDNFQQKIQGNELEKKDMKVNYSKNFKFKSFSCFPRRGNFRVQNQSDFIHKKHISSYAEGNLISIKFTKNPISE